MPFSIARAPMLELLAEAMEIQLEGRSAFLGRFQHLQRLKLIEGINPGRGIAAEYKANHVVMIALSMQMLQLGLTPERAVTVVKFNEDYIRLAIGLAISERRINPSLLWFDAALLSPTTIYGRDFADATFNIGDFSTFNKQMKFLFETGYMQRLSVISLGNTLWNLIMVMDDAPRVGGARHEIGSNGQVFINALADWFEATEPNRVPA